MAGVQRRGGWSRARRHAMEWRQSALLHGWCLLLGECVHASHAGAPPHGHDVLWTADSFATTCPPDTERHQHWHATTHTGPGRGVSAGRGPCGHRQGEECEPPDATRVVRGGGDISHIFLHGRWPVPWRALTPPAPRPPAALPVNHLHATPSPPAATS